MTDARSWYSATLRALETADGPRRRKRRRSSAAATSNAVRARYRGAGNPNAPAGNDGGQERPGGGGGVVVVPGGPSTEAGGVTDGGGTGPIGPGGGGGVVINPGGGMNLNSSGSVATTYSGADYSGSAMFASMRGLGRRGRRMPCIGPMAGMGCGRCGGTCGRRR